MGREKRIFLITCRCAIIELTRSTLVREAMTYLGFTVVALSQSRKGDTPCFVPTSLDIACIICHKVAGARIGETISGCTR